jgi:RHS repeat-associated protein
LYSTKDSQLIVGRSFVGRTNLLKSVQRPLGASFEVEYERSGNTYKQPHSKWVMSRVAVHDGHEGDGVDVQVKTYRYEDGFYNRQERDFYGYRVLVEEHRDNSQDDKLYRSITREFHNDSYYRKGLLVKETTADADGNLYLETENAYVLRNVDTGHELVNPNHLTATVFPELRRTEKRFYEGQPQAGKTTYTENQFDALGNITHFVDGADVGTQDDVFAEIGYFKDEANYIVGKANKIVVTDSSGTVLRRREAIFESGTGNLSQVSIYLADGSAATSNIAYDQYGNIQRLQGPTNYKGQRYSLTYTYDDTVHTHNTSVTDSFGYVSRGDYNFKYGKVVNTTDINNNPLDYTYDPFGRVKTIVGPYQTGTGLDTIKFEYHPEAEIPWALTQHIDVYRDVSDPIETVLFTDGLKRVLQTKKDATIHANEGRGGNRDVMIVSGHVTFDFLGRGIEQYYPITEALGKQGVFNTGVDSIQPTVTVYDVMDRTVSTTIPDATSTLMAYGFGLDRKAQTQFLTKVTDANGISKESYKDVRGVITAVKEFNEGETLWTSYEYDSLKQIVTVVDDQNNVTTVSYDNLGRRTQIDSPDMGLTETVYDLASNVRQKITANLRATGQAIVYDYDYNRLNSIIYPNFTDNNVAYTYGAPGAADNRANRVVTISDESGTSESFYGPLGEVVKTINTINVDAGQPEVYTTEYEYDTWNRLLRLVYPDGEVLTHEYDSGGLVRAIAGEKAGNQYAYLNQLDYDKFGQRVFVDFGNGVRTNYSYNPLNRRLSVLKAGKGRLFQNLTYEYDKVGNILGQANSATVNSPNQLGGATQYQYEYDDLYRLTHAEGTFDFEPNKQHSYQLDMVYDSIHNIKAKTQVHNLQQPSGNLIEQKKTTYDWLYAYAGEQPHAPTHIGERTFSYDANGNQTGWEHDDNGTRRTIVWDEENRIQSIADNGSTTNYKYNAAGERVIKRGSHGETVYVNQFFVIRNGSNATKNVFVGASRIVAKLVKQEKSSINGKKKPKGPVEKDLYFYHPDHLGSTAYVTDAKGSVHQHFEYMPFGETFVEQSSGNQLLSYGFTGKELDTESGLYYFGARYYDPKTSVWASADPILGAYLGGKAGMGGVFNSFNLGLYGYAHLNPVMLVDPDGNQVDGAAAEMSKPDKSDKKAIDLDKYRNDLNRAVYAIKEFKKNNITMSSTSGGTDKFCKSCTSLMGIKGSTVDGITNLRKDYKRIPDFKFDCPFGKLIIKNPVTRKGFKGDINVTGGTENGHSSGHTNGYKIDLSLNTELNKYIKDNSYETKTRKNKKGKTETGYRVNGIDGVFWKEGDHWDYSVTD